MQAALRRDVEAALGETIIRSRPLHGGCINEAFCCTLKSGERVFIKSKPGCDPRIFPAEARGLEWLDQAKALRVPQVVHANENFLALEYIEPGQPAADYDERLGRGLARLHRFGAASFGFAEDGFLATLLQCNQVTTTWSNFYIEHRLQPLVRQAIAQELLPRDCRTKFEVLYTKMPTLVGELEPPARLHGDLWSGNLHCDGRGNPVLIDPAAYGGHREVDLAMLELFGSPSPHLYRAYNDEYPLQPDYAERRALYQLYPLLAHVLLFSGGYGSQCLAALARYL